MRTRNDTPCDLDAVIARIRQEAAAEEAADAGRDPAGFGVRRSPGGPRRSAMRRLISLLRMAERRLRDSLALEHFPWRPATQRAMSNTVERLERLE